jgi:hypothetical protein
MNRPAERKGLSGLLLLVILALALPARAGVLEPRGALARWLGTEVAPALGEQLRRHPNFRGETFTFVTLREGVPSPETDALTSAVEAELRSRLLAAPGLRLAVDAARDPCAAPVPVPWAIAIGITPGSGGRARVELAVLDVAEGVWVAGTSHVWQGHLATAERRALARPAAVTATGTVDAPLAVSRGTEIADRLVAQLRCALPGGLDGPVHLDAGAAPGRVGAALRSALARAPVGALAARPEEASWQLLLEPGAGAPGGVRELVLVLRERDRPATQRVASVFVTGPGGAPAGPASEAPMLLLAPLRLERVPPRGVCGDAQAGGCVEIAAELLEPAWLVVFGTRGDRVHPLSCGREPERSEAGERRFRTAVPFATEARPGAGLYVLATRDRNRARRLQALVRTAPGACGNAGGERAAWIDALDRELASEGEAVSWRALHLGHVDGRVARL